MLRTALLLPLALLAGCAVGGTQAVTLTSVPSGAACAVDRAGAHLGVVTLTPGVLPLYQSASPLEVTCSLPGYKTALVVQPAQPAGTGAAYPPVIQVVLPPVTAGAPGLYVPGYAEATARTASGRRVARRGGARRAYARVAQTRRYASRSAYRRTRYSGTYVPGIVVPGTGPAEDYRRSPYVLRDPVAQHTAAY